MKKTYIAPLVYAESLVLSHHIAACTTTAKFDNHADEKYCGVLVTDPDDVDLNGQKIFSSTGYCGDKDRDIHDDYADAEGYCYTNSTNSKGFFGS